MKKKIGIVGAGVMGRTLAWQLLQDAEATGHDVHISLFDKDPIHNGQAAAYTAAGMLTPYCEVETAEPLIYELGMHALTLWPELVASLNQDVDFQQRGSIIVSHNNDRADYLRFRHQLNTKLSDDAREHFSELNQQQLNTLSPELAEGFREALYIPNEAWVDTHRYMHAIATALLEKGVTWHEQTEAVELLSDTNEIKTANETYSFDHIIDCRGVFAKSDISGLRGVRGEVITLHAPEVHIDRLVRLMHPRYRLYLVPRQNHHYVLGATQIESEDSAPITVRSALELLSAVYSLHSGFSEARVINTSANCRPALPDNLPRIEYTGNIMRINGLFRHGFLLSPLLAKEAARQLLTPAAESPFAHIIFNTKHQQTTEFAV